MRATHYIPIYFTWKHLYFRVLEWVCVCCVYGVFLTIRFFGIFKCSAAGFSPRDNRKNGIPARSCERNFPHNHARGVTIKYLMIYLADDITHSTLPRRTVRKQPIPIAYDIRFYKIVGRTSWPNVFDIKYRYADSVYMRLFTPAPQ